MASWKLCQPQLSVRFTVSTASSDVCVGTYRILSAISRFPKSLGGNAIELPAEVAVFNDAVVHFFYSEFEVRDFLTPDSSSKI